ncbi:uncharacterized protein [Drosophila virilis]|uniref:uncharacterized protein n=1 Tax=Drosophila virilis TaxID=7244 RepID=UPI00139617E5|nr:uncharacterized protein LOC116651857 [Drosophila virilis]
MYILFSYIVIMLCTMASISGKTVFDQLFQSEPRGGYYYPAAYQGGSYQGYYDQRYGQPQRSRPRSHEHQRSYKDICRMVNTNGFTNPSGVPRCPY